jgi:Ca-activated chloride channel family protein
MWIFDRPGLLLLLTLLIPAIFFCHFYRGRGGVFPASFAVWAGRGFKPRCGPLRLVLLLSNTAFWLGTAGLVLALAGPSYVEREKIYISRGIDIVFVLDESPSMAALDFPPSNRFDAAREVIKKFVNSRENDPVGLVTFAEEAALRIPPTLDYKGFMDKIDSLSMMELGNGTAVGLGIAIAALHMQNSTAENKVMILISDGENNAGEIVPDSGAAIAAEMGIKIHTIGIGTKGEVPIEYEDKETGRIITGQFNSDFDEQLLRSIAEKTGGQYYYAPGTNALNNIIGVIDALESKERRTKINTTSKPGHRQLIFLSMIMIMADFFIKKSLFREVL